MTVQSTEPTLSKANSPSASQETKSQSPSPAPQSKYSDEIVELLVKAFEDGSTITEACRTAQIDRQTYYNWREWYPETFGKKMDAAIDYPDAVAKMVIVRAIKNGDVETAKWWGKNKLRNEFYEKTKNEADVKVEVIKPLLELDAVRQDDSDQKDISTE